MKNEEKERKSVIDFLSFSYLSPYKVVPSKMGLWIDWIIQKNEEVMKVQGNFTLFSRQINRKFTYSQGISSFLPMT
jgi:hypothetical protein